jgi:TusA-related sulfurtransferase
MKKLIMIFAIAVLPAITFAQSAFSQFEGKDDIAVVTISDKAFELFGGEIKTDAGGDKAKKYLDQVKNLESLKVYTTTNKKYRKDIKKAVVAYLKQNGLTELVSVNEGGSEFKVYIKQGKSSSEVKELLLFADNDDESKEIVLVSLTGTITL